MDPHRGGGGHLFLRISTYVYRLPTSSPPTPLHLPPLAPSPFQVGSSPVRPLKKWPCWGPHRGRSLDKRPPLGKWLGVCTALRLTHAEDFCFSPVPRETLLSARKAHGSCSLKGPEEGVLHLQVLYKHHLKQTVRVTTALPISGSCWGRDATPPFSQCLPSALAWGQEG